MRAGPPLAGPQTSFRLVALRFVLDSQTRAFSAEVQLSQAELSERLDIVDLYQALGGGWQPEIAAVPAPGQSPGSSPNPSASPAPSP